jgi:hypothetical protein
LADTKANISEHIKTIFESDELDRDSTVRKFRTVQKEGGREVSRNLEHYNLDVIISVGYRVNSLKATRFRQWATSVLKQYIINGYTINGGKITHQRFKELENDVALLKSKINLFENKALKASHDRFMIIDEVHAYHIGASLKDLGKKWFAFSRMDAKSLAILKRLNDE